MEGEGGGRRQSYAALTGCNGQTVPPFPSLCHPFHRPRRPRRRVAYALETHGVVCSRLAPTPTAEALRGYRPLLPKAAADFVVSVGPYLAVALVYAATSYVRWKKVSSGGGGGH